jgi:predicted aspartyl protease
MHLSMLRGGAATMGLTLALAACGASAPAPVTPGKAVPTATATLAAEPTATPAPSGSADAGAAPAHKLAKLRFDMNGQDFDAPLVDVLVGGQPTTLIVDTGATHNLVASWVAAQVGPTTKANTNGLDHAGQSVALQRLEGVDIRVSGWGPLGVDGTLVAELPAELKKWGIGGVLAVQPLIGEGRAVVIDLRKRTLSEASWDDAVHALEAEKGVAITGDVRACGTAGTLAYVHATVGGAELDAQVDTGATNTTVRADSPAGVRLRPLAKTASAAYAASGLFTVPSVDGAHVKVGALDVATTVDLVRRDARPVCPNDAFVGMDVLRKCTLVFGRTTMSARCDPPG